MRELGAALRLYEEENSRLAEERDHWSRLAKEWEGHCASLPDIDDYKPELVYYQTKIREMKSQLDVSKGDISEKLEEQVKSANKRYQIVLKKCEMLEKDKIELEAKVLQLGIEKKKYAEKWQSLALRVKHDEKLRARIKDLEEAGNLLSNRLEIVLQRNKELEEKWKSSEQSRSREYTGVRRAAGDVRELETKLRAISEENDMLELLNKELAMKVSRLQRGGSSGRNCSALETAYAEEMERNKLLEEDVSRLRKELAAVRTQMSRSTAASPDPTPRTGRKKEESLSSLVKSLKELAQSPLRAMKDSDAGSEADKYSPDSLRSRVHVMNSERKPLHKVMVQSWIHNKSIDDTNTPGYWTPMKPTKTTHEHDRSWS